MSNRRRHSLPPRRPSRGPRTCRHQCATPRPASTKGEAKRQALNEWIRTGGAYDAVLDFAAVVQDPAQPTKSRPEYDSGDHLHPSPAAYAAMANSIDLGLFRPTKE